MNNISYENLKEYSLFLKIFGQEKTEDDKPQYVRFMNDNYFVKTLEESFLRADVFTLKGQSYIDMARRIDKVCCSCISGGTNILFAEGQVWGEDELSYEEGHYLTEKSIKRAMSILTKEHTEKIDGNYILLVHPDVADRINKDEHLNKKLNGERCGIKAIETDMLPTYKNAKGETVYCSFLFGDYAFGIKVLEEQGVCGIRRINESHMVRIETVGLPLCLSGKYRKVQKEVI